MVGQLLLIADWFDCHKALYGAWLVNAHVSDFDGGYRMGRLAITLMNRLEAKEVKPIASVLSLVISFSCILNFIIFCMDQFIPRVYMTVYGFINSWVSLRFAVGKYYLVIQQLIISLSSDLQ